MTVRYVVLFCIVVAAIVAARWVYEWGSEDTRIPASVWERK